jgi:hypothetical protein
MCGGWGVWREVGKGGGLLCVCVRACVYVVGGGGGVLPIVYF